MVNSCVAPGCAAGYKKTVENVSLFKFPNDEALKKKWIARVPRIKWTPSNNSRLCEKHFIPSDFLEERGDKTRGRGVKRGELIRRRLKHDAIPTVWPNLPDHLSKEITSPRPTKLATSSSRKIVLNERNREKEQEAQQKDYFGSILELITKFCLNDLPVASVIKEGQYALFVSLKAEECQKLNTV